ncbi:MAG: fasciclin domain-containing protein [Bacteroidota bacterium]|nr:fasciclin domain-containing protein [Bacteroidota bacterium]
MKKKNYLFYPVSRIRLSIIAFLGMTLSLSSCYNSDDIQGNLYTFTDKNMGQYIESDTTLSEFNKLMDKTLVKGLLNAFGAYTCFAPSNQAMREFYKVKGKKSIEDFPADSLKLIAYDHLINGAVVMSNYFPNGRLSYTTMSNRYITVSIPGTGDVFINKTSKLLSKDVEVHNGVIQKIDHVLDPVRSGLADVVSKDSTFTLFYKALVATGLVDSMYKTVDEKYHLTASDITTLDSAVNTSIASERHAPTTRRFGYTLLMESNQTMNKYGITDLESLKKYAANVYDNIYPEDAGITDPTNRANSLNRFVAYHMINKELSYSKFIKDYDTQHMSKVVDMYEYIETMCPNTLIEVMLNRKNGEYNLFNRSSETGNCVRIVTSNYDNDASNGVYHEVDQMLVYSNDVMGELSSKRLRFDFASLFPELTNNNMRGRASNNTLPYRNALPSGYLDRLKCTDQTVVCYGSAFDKYMDFEGDEFFIAVQNGKLYDFTVTTPPVPAGTYEIRFGYQSNGKRGVAQFYVDGVPTGVPVNLNNVGSNPAIGYVVPGSNQADPLGYENDKMMRNRGYMKGPASFKAVDASWYSGNSARYNGSNLRKILGIYSFQQCENHKITVKGLSGGQFQIDFIEFVPTNAIEGEDIN